MRRSLRRGEAPQAAARAAAHAPRHGAVTTDRPVAARPRALIAGGLAVIIAAVLVVYAPLLEAPALTWDDGEHIFDNAAVQGGWWRAIWSGPEFGMYIPVTRTVWAVVYALGAGAVWPFRLLNLAVHGVNVLLVARLLWVLLRATSRPADATPAPIVPMLLGTLVFAVHPVQVATVAWISGGRDLLASGLALTAMLTALCTILSARTARETAQGTARGTALKTAIGMAVSTAAFAAALLCKPQVAGVPLALVLIVGLVARHHTHSKRAEARGARQVSWASWLTLLVWTGLVIGVVMTTQAAQSTAPQVPLVARLFVAVDALGFYARELIWPWPLAADYGRTPAWLLAHPSSAAAGLLVLAAWIAAAWFIESNRGDSNHGDSNHGESRSALPALGMWGLLLLPVLGLVPFAYQRISTVADHYLYLPMVGVAAFVAAAVRWTGARWGSPRLWLGVGGCMLVVGVGLSVHRTAVWREGDNTFYRAMLAANPDSFSARINLSVQLCEQGATTEGLAMLDGARALAQQDAPYIANRTFCLLQAHQTEAVLREALQLQSEVVQHHLEENPRAAAVFINSVANVLHQQGNEMAAFAWLCRAQAMQPGDATTATNLSAARGILQGGGPDVACPDGLTWARLLEVARPAS